MLLSLSIQLTEPVASVSQGSTVPEPSPSLPALLLFLCSSGLVKLLR